MMVVAVLLSTMVCCPATTVAVYEERHDRDRHGSVAGTASELRDDPDSDDASASSRSPPIMILTVR